MARTAAISGMGRWSVEVFSRDWDNLYIAELAAECSQRPLNSQSPVKLKPMPNTLLRLCAFPNSLQGKDLHSSPATKAASGFLEE
jgi:hypothetical protein